MLKDFFGEPIKKRDKVLLEYENVIRHAPKRSKFDLTLEHKELKFEKKKEMVVKVVQKPKKRIRNVNKSKK